MKVLMSLKTSFVYILFMNKVFIFSMLSHCNVLTGEDRDGIREPGRWALQSTAQEGSGRWQDSRVGAKDRDGDIIEN